MGQFNSVPVLSLPTTKLGKNTTENNYVIGLCELSSLHDDDWSSKTGFYSMWDRYPEVYAKTPYFFNTNTLLSSATDVRNVRLEEIISTSVTLPMDISTTFNENTDFSVTSTIVNNVLTLTFAPSSLASRTVYAGNMDSSDFYGISTDTQWIGREGGTITATSSLPFLVPDKPKNIYVRFQSLNDNGAPTESFWARIPPNASAADGCLSVIAGLAGPVLQDHSLISLPLGLVDVGDATIDYRQVALIVIGACTIVSGAFKMSIPLRVAHVALGVLIVTLASLSIRQKIDIVDAGARVWSPEGDLLYSLGQPTPRRNFLEFLRR